MWLPCSATQPLIQALYPALIPLTIVALPIASHKCSMGLRSRDLAVFTIWGILSFQVIVNKCCSVWSCIIIQKNEFISHSYSKKSHCRLKNLDSYAVICTTEKAQGCV
ncbi:hypothetical protein TNCV_3791531 [Trichonephila clavipes]|nr:hypothetical protein TNCV_3791531 [Trichonephila clavipes]